MLINKTGTFIPVAMGQSFSQAVDDASDHKVKSSELDLLKQSVLGKIEEQKSKLTMLNGEYLPIMGASVTNHQAMVLKVDAVSENQVRHSLKELLKGYYLEELVVLLTEKMNDVLKSAIAGGQESLFAKVVFASKSISRLDLFVYFRSLRSNESLKDYNNILAYFIQVGLLDILKVRPQVLQYNLTKVTEEDNVNHACEKLKARENCVQGNSGSSCNTWAQFPDVSIFWV